MERWLSRVAVVTGASRGIGAAICTNLVKYGLHVFACDKNVEKVKELANRSNVIFETGRLYPIRCDVSQKEEVVAMFEEIRSKEGRVDICINNAGTILSSYLSHGQAKDLRRTFQMNFLGTVNCTLEALRLMKETGVCDGTIIQMAGIVELSSSPRRMAHTGVVIYKECTHRIYEFSHFLRQDLRKENSRIRITVIRPGDDLSFMLDCAFRTRSMVPLLQATKSMSPDGMAAAVVELLKVPPHIDLFDIIIEPKEFSI